jgi:hypothetical protein
MEQVGGTEYADVSNDETFCPIGDIVSHTQMRRKNAERVQELVDHLCDSY